MKPILDESVLALAEQQHAMLTTPQLTRCALSAPELVRLVKDGHLTHPGRGLYAVTSLLSEDPAERHGQFAHGATLLYRDAVLASTTALVAHGIPVWGVDLTRPKIHRPVDRGRCMSAFWTRPLRGAVIDSPLGPTTNIADALVLHALDEGIVPGVVSADHALHEQKVTLEQLTEAVESVRTWPRGSRARAMLAMTDGLRESVGESRCAVEMLTHGFEFESQVVIRDQWGHQVARADFVITGRKVVVEFDGKVKYAEGQAETLWNEKKREDKLRALGYVVVRITWADLERPGAVAAKIRAGLRAWAA